MNYSILEELPSYVLSKYPDQIVMTLSSTPYKKSTDTIVFRGEHLSQVVKEVREYLERMKK